MKRLAVIALTLFAAIVIPAHTQADNPDDGYEKENWGPKYEINGSTLSMTARHLKHLAKFYQLPPEWPEKVLKNKIRVLTVNEAVRKLNESDSWTEIGQGGAALHPGAGEKPDYYPLIIEFEGRISDFRGYLSQKDGNKLSYTFALDNIYKNKEEFILPLKEDQVHNKALVQDVTLVDIDGDTISKENFLNGEVGNYARFFLSNADWNKKVKIKAFIDLARIDYTLNDKEVWSVDERHYAIVKFQLNIVILQAWTQD